MIARSNIYGIKLQVKAEIQPKKSLSNKLNEFVIKLKFDSFGMIIGAVLTGFSSFCGVEAVVDECGEASISLRESINEELSLAGEEIEVVFIDDGCFFFFLLEFAFEGEFKEFDMLVDCTLASGSNFKVC